MIPWIAGEKSSKSTCSNEYNDAKHKLTPLTNAEARNLMRKAMDQLGQKRQPSSGIRAVQTCEGEPEIKMLIKDLAL